MRIPKALIICVALCGGGVVVVVLYLCAVSLLTSIHIPLSISPPVISGLLPPPDVGLLRRHYPGYLWTTLDDLISSIVAECHTVGSDVVAASDLAPWYAWNEGRDRLLLGAARDRSLMRSILNGSCAPRDPEGVGKLPFYGSPQVASNNVVP